MTIPVLNNLKPARPLAAVDTETTGLDPKNRPGGVDGGRPGRAGRPVAVWHTWVDPGMPVLPAAAAVHGLTNAALAAAPPFRRVAGELLAMQTGADLVSFKYPFNLLMLEMELRRVSRALPLAGVAVLDPLTVYRRHRPHTLAAADREYMGQEHDGAHDAGADAAAALAVLDAQVAAHGLPAVPCELHRLICPADVGGRLRPGPATGGLALAFGRHPGRLLGEVASPILRASRSRGTGGPAGSTHVTPGVRSRTSRVSGRGTRGRVAITWAI